MMGDYTRDYLARQFTVRELRRFLSGRHIPIDSCTEKHDLIELVMQLRRSSMVRAEEEEHSRYVSQLRVIVDCTPCLKKKLCKIVFVTTSSNFHQF